MSWVELRWNPNQPRWPKGSGRNSGQWRGGAAKKILNAITANDRAVAPRDKKLNARQTKEWNSATIKALKDSGGKRPTKAQVSVYLPDGHPSKVKAAVAEPAPVRKAAVRAPAPRTPVRTTQNKPVVKKAAPEPAQPKLRQSAPARTVTRGAPTALPKKNGKGPTTTRDAMGQENAKSVPLYTGGSGVFVRGKGVIDQPVSKVFNLGSHRTLAPHVSHALKQIDKVHSDGELDAVNLAALRGHSEGQMRMSSRGENTLKIRLDARQPELTATHEIGHLLDYRVLGPSGVYNTNRHEGEGAYNGTTGKSTPEQDAAIKAWASAVMATPEMRAFEDWMKRISRARLDGTPEESDSAHAESQWVAYLTSPHEIFARSYAQYIALRSGDPLLKRQVDQRLKADLPPSHGQWEWQNFGPIADALDKVFEAQGYIT